MTRHEFLQAGWLVVLDPSDKYRPYVWRIHRGIGEVVMTPPAVRDWERIPFGHWVVPPTVAHIPFALIRAHCYCSDLTQPSVCDFCIGRRSPPDAKPSWNKPADRPPQPWEEA